MLDVQIWNTVGPGTEDSILRDLRPVSGSVTTLDTPGLVKELRSQIRFLSITLEILFLQHKSKISKNSFHIFRDIIKEKECLEEYWI